MKHSISILLLALLLGSFSCAQTPAKKSRTEDTFTKTSKKEKIMKTDAEWKDQLSDMEYYVTREKGTERAFTGKYWDHHEKGMYTCVCCGEPLFDSDTKYESGSGWPSFYQPAKDGIVDEISDRSHGMVRTEVTCSKCDAHLGHVFNDGPQPTGLRYCINSASLGFAPEAQAGLDVEFEEETGEETGAEAVNKGEGDGKTAEVTFGAGCFWCIEAVFLELEGVVSVESGYSGGETKNPTYKDICTGLTGHAEVARIVYEPAVISFEDLLEVFWKTHDPTTLNRQGNDVGTQYRSVIFYHDATQKEKAEYYKQQLDASGAFDRPIVTEISPLGDYYPAEDYHQNYFNLNPGQGYCQYVIRPKLEKFRKAFKDKLKKD